MRSVFAIIIGTIAVWGPSAATAAPAPAPVVIWPCASIPAVGSLTGGGRFVVDPANETCTVQAQLGQSTAPPWCLSHDNSSAGIYLHSVSWATSNQIGGWALAGSAEGGFQLRQEHNYSGCLTLDIIMMAVTSAPCAPLANAGAAGQLWVVDNSNALLRLAGSSSCLAWGDNSGSGQGVFVVDTSPAGLRQVVEGVEVELQSDSIGSDNSGLPDVQSGVPHDLTEPERERFATEVLSGTRTIRLAMGLYLRGLTPDRANVVGRWPTQMAELLQLQQLSKIEGWAPEYWSPAPHWKDNQNYIGGGLAGFNATFLDSFGDAVVADLQYLTENGLRVTWFGLQNEPNYESVNVTCPQTLFEPEPEPEPESRIYHPRPGGAPDTYSTCTYSACQYYEAFKAVVPKVRAWGNNTLRVHANSWSGQLGASPVANDPSTLALVDAWSWHHVGQAAGATFGNNTGPSFNTFGKISFTNEMEYQPGSEYAGTAIGTINSVNMYLNSLVFSDAPLGVISLHAAKPIENAESLGYGWTWWRPPFYLNTSVFPTLAPGSFVFNYWNWAAVAPFIKLLPWNSPRRNVMEDVQRLNQRVAAFETPAAGLGGPLHQTTAAGKLIVVLTNQDPAANFTATVGFNGPATPRVFAGFRFAGSADGSQFNISLGTSTAGSSFTTTLLPLTAEWWLEQ